MERRVGDKTLQMVRLTEAEPEKLTPKQQQVYELLGQVGCGSIREVCYFAGVTRGVVESWCSRAWPKPTNRKCCAPR